MSGHLVPRAAVDDGDLVSSQAQRRPGSVNGGIATAQHCHPLPYTGLSTVKVDFLQKVNGVHHTQVLTRDIQLAAVVRPHADKDGLVALLVQLGYCDVLTDGDARSDLHAHLLDEFDLPI